MVKYGPSKCTKMMPLLVTLYGCWLVGVVHSASIEQIGNLSYFYQGEPLWTQSTIQVLSGLTGPIPLELGSLSNLTHLSIGSGLTGPIPSELGNLSHLTILDLSQNSLSGLVPPELGKLTQLTELGLGNNNLSGPIPPELGKLTQLEFLDLSNNDFSGPIPPELGKLTRLKSLYLGNNSLSGPIPPELGKLTQLWTLNLSSNNLSGSIPSALGQLSQVNYLYLGNNTLSGPIPPELGNLTHLWGLNLGNNNLSGPIPPELGQLSQLDSLDLGNNILSGPICPELGKLTLLWSLNLGNNNLSGAIPPELGKLERLNSLDVSKNNFSGPLPPELLQMIQVSSLDFSGNNLLEVIYTNLTKGLAKTLYMHIDGSIGTSPDSSSLEETLSTVGQVAFLSLRGGESDSGKLDLSSVPSRCQYIQWRGSPLTAIEFWGACSTDGLGCVVDISGTDAKLSRDAKRKICLGGKVSVFISVEVESFQFKADHHDLGDGYHAVPSFYISNTYGDYFLNDTRFLETINLGPQGVTYSSTGKIGNLCANPGAGSVMAIAYGVFGVLILVVSMHLVMKTGAGPSKSGGGRSSFSTWAVYAGGVVGGVLPWVDIYTDAQVLVEVWGAWPMWFIIASLLFPYMVAGGFLATSWPRWRRTWMIAHSLRFRWIFPPSIEDRRLLPLSNQKLNPLGVIVATVLWPIAIAGVLVQDILAGACRIGWHPIIENEVYSMELYLRSRLMLDFCSRSLFQAVFQSVLFKLGSSRATRIYIDPEVFSFSITTSLLSVLWQYGSILSEVLVDKQPFWQTILKRANMVRGPCLILYATSVMSEVEVV